MRTRLLHASAANAAWITAAMRGVVGVEQALDALQALRATPRVGQNTDLEDDGLAIALQRWRRREITGWRYVPAAPADAAGVPGPVALRSSAIEQGAALVSVDGQPRALLPVFAESDERHQASHVLLLERDADTHGLMPFDSVSEADRALLQALHEAVETMEGLDVTQWRDDVPGLRDGWHDTPVLPPGASERATRLAARSLRVLELVDLASTDAGGSRTAHEMTARATTFAQVAAAARAAHATAWNTGLNELERRR